jgi:SAM-dependent methyltransferase
MSQALDILYPSGFYSYQAPVHLDYVAALGGLAPPAGDGAPFTYLDLGCGDGFTIILLAAVYPESRFLGVDLNPGHVAVGTALAKAGGIDNVRLIEGGFEEWRRLDLPECDYIAMHGVYAWISEAAREAVLALTASRLKPAGLLYAGYNAYPGWAAIAPLRQFFLDYTRGMAGDPVANIGATLRHLRELRAKGAGFFAQNPSAASVLEDMAGKDIRYVAHEIYSPYWSPLPFSAVATQMESAGLAFAGSADLQHNYARPSVKPEFVPLLLKETDRRRAELYRDTVNNTFFRRDVFVKGAAPRPSPAEVARRLEPFSFGSRVPLGELNRALALPDGEMTLETPLFRALQRALADGSSRIDELRQRPELAATPAEVIAQAIQMLTLGHQIVPFAAPTAPVGGATPADWTIPLALNRRLIKEPLAGMNPLLPMAPALGIPAPMVRDDALVLLAVAEAGRAGAAAWAWDFAVERRAFLTRKGAPATDRAAHDTALAEILTALAPRLAKYAEIGVIKPR